MRKLLIVGMGLVVLGMGPGVRADQKVTLETVVVTATKTEEKRKDISNSMVIKDNEDIREASADNLGELLANEPGIDWRTYGDYGGASQAFQIRGMESSEALVMVNGLSLNSPSLGQADVGGILLNNIERVEVVKGSGSLLYGSGAMAGTVNVITKSPSRERMDLAVRAGYGSQSTYQLSAENGMFVTRDMGYYLTANHLITDGHRDNGDLVHNDASLKLLLDKGDTLNISLYSQIVDRESGVPGVHPPDGTADFYLPATGERLYSSESASLKGHSDTQDIHSLLEIRSQPFQWLGWRVAGKYTHTESINESWLNADNPYTGELAGEGSRSTVTNTVPGAEADVEIQPWHGATVLIGTDFQDQEWDTKTTDLNRDGSAKGADSTNDADLYSLGTFAEGQYRPFKYIKLQAGLRQEHHSTFGTEYLPRYGLILNPFETTAIKINRGKHFKAPTPNDLFWPEDSFVRGNPDLSPQTGWHTDVTAEQQLAANKLFLTATYFNWNIRDKITWAPNPAFPGPFGDKWTPTNLNRSRAYGFEAGARYDPDRHVTLEAGYTRTMAKEEVGAITRQARYVPDYQVKFSATYRSDVGTLVTGTWRYTDERFNYRSGSVTEPDDILKAYATVDLKVQQRILEHWLVSIDGRNLLDEDYDTYVNTFVDSTGSRFYGVYPGAGRSVFAAVTYEY